jgi:hypothetical protein
MELQNAELEALKENTEQRNFKALQAQKFELGEENSLMVFTIL